VSRGKARIQKMLGIVLTMVMVLLLYTRVNAATTIESTYAATGPNAVTTTVITNSSGANLYKIYRPTTLTGTNSYPIIVMGNGTNCTSVSYDGILTHLASWGFVCIGDYDSTSGTGSNIVSTANYIIGLNSTTTSVLYQKLNVNMVAAMGHSQDGAGILNAYNNYTGGKVFKTLLPVSRARNSLSSMLGYTSPVMSTVRVPVFFTRGTGSTDSWILPNSELTKYYNNLPSGYAAVMGTCKSTDHNEICSSTGGKLRGYITAWFRYQLMNDTTARSAFAGTSGEIKGNTTNWQGVATKNVN
jgi:hypothetical protein